MHETSIADGTPTSGVDRARSLYLSAGVQLSYDDVAIVDLGPTSNHQGIRKKGFRVRRRRIWRSLFRAGLLFNQYMKFFLVKGDPIAEHRVIPKPRCARAVGYRLDVFKELISIRSVETPRRGRQAECSVERSAMRSCACGARSSLGKLWQYSCAAAVPAQPITVLM